MSVFVDTSALVAALSADDRQHDTAAATWRDLVAGDELLMTTNYVVLELHALMQRRAGLGAVRTFADLSEPALQVHYLGREAHAAGVATLLAANRRDLNLVDCTSFLVMRELGLTRVFAFDPHFAEQGFEVLPAPG